MPLENKYKDYLLEDFVSDDDFITWVQGGHTEVEEWVNAHPEKAKLINEARQVLLDLSRPMPQDHTLVKQELWTRIDNSISEQTKGGRLRTLRWAIPMTAAACALFFLYINVFSDSMIEINTEKMEQETIALADMSTILTNEKSKVSYNKKTYKEKRVIQLEGEAFFEVEKGKTFTVETPLGSVTVLGTSFNVIARGGRFEVECFTGKVSVENNKGEQVILTPGEKSIQRAEQLEEVALVFQSKQPKWLAPKKTYNATPLSEVVNDLKAQYPFVLDVDEEVQNLPISGQITFANLEETLETITWPLKLTYTIEQDTIRIYANK